MNNNDLVKALRRLKVETGSLACLGCGYEHNCSTGGCAILREAEEAIKHNGWVSANERLPVDVNDDFVLGVVNGRGKNVRYVDAVCFVGYDPKTGWYLEEDPELDVDVSWWMEAPDPPSEEERDGE